LVGWCWAVRQTAGQVRGQTKHVPKPLLCACLHSLCESYHHAATRTVPLTVFFLKRSMLLMDPSYHTRLGPPRFAAYSLLLRWRVRGAFEVLRRRTVLPPAALLTWRRSGRYIGSLCCFLHVLALLIRVGRRRAHWATVLVHLVCSCTYEPAAMDHYSNTDEWFGVHLALGCNSVWIAEGSCLIAEEGRALVVFFAGFDGCDGS